MSFSLRDVSIPVILLMLRGGILVLAPVVDLLFGRRIRWWSVVALVTVAIALSLVLFQGGGLKLSALALLTICSYNVGFLMRLTVMTQVAKRGDAAQSRGFFVEEKLVALPLGILGLIGLTLVGIGAPGEGLDGILHVQWTPLLAWQVLRNRRDARAGVDARRDDPARRAGKQFLRAARTLERITGGLRGRLDPALRLAAARAYGVRDAGGGDAAGRDPVADVGIAMGAAGAAMTAP